MFKFKGISSTDMQVVIEEEEHFIARAAKRYETIEIEGRDGAIFNELGYSYVERPIYVQCLNIDKIDDILAWLDGEGEFEYKERKTTARFYSQLDPRREGYIRIIDTTFIRDPFWTKANDEFVTVKDSKITETEETKSIHVEDASTIGQLEVLGNVEQKTREGYNILDYLPNIRSSINGLTVDKDEETGYITVNGTPTANYTTIITKQSFTDIVEDGEMYTLWQENHSSNFGGSYLQVMETNKDGSGVHMYYNSCNANRTLTVNKTLYNYSVSIQSGTISQAGTFSNYKNRYMIYKGTDEKPYEQYGASPSPEYPSEIRAVGDNINLLENTAKTQIINGVEFTVNPDKTIKINGTATENISTDITKNFAITEQSIFSGMCDGYGYNKMLIQIQGTDYNVNIPNSTPQVLQPKDNVKVRIYIYAGTSINNAIIRPKIEKGTVATSYSEFGQGSVGIKKQNKNLFDISKYPFTNKVAYSRTGELNFWTGYCGIIGYFPVKEDTNYVFSNNLNKPITYGLMFYNKNKEFISGIVENTTKFVTPKNCKYIRFAIQSDTLPIWVQIELGDTATEYVEHEQTDYILNIQQEMLKGDYFIKEDDGWKEVHNYSKIELTGQETVQHNTNYTNSTMVQIPENNNYNFFIPTNLNATYVISNKFLGVSRNKCSSEKGINTVSLGNNEGRLLINVANKIVGIDGTETNQVKAQKLKEWLVDKKILIYYKSKEVLRLPCTSEQSVVLEELNNLDLFKPVTNIVTAENIALLKLKYMQQTSEKINNEGNIESRPILRLEKTSTESVELTINNCRFKYNFNNEEYVEIDCEEKEVKYEGLNRNRQIEIGYDFPILNVGDNDIKMHSGDCIIKVLRKDRWL